MRKLLLLILFTIALFGEHIEEYNTKVAIKSNSQASVVEQILYNFDGAIRHGIYRDIPKNDTVIKNIRVLKDGTPTEYKLINNQNFWRIRIGSANSYVRGRVKYTISYNLKGMIVREAKNSNFIAYDLVGTGWRKPIYSAKGTLYLPKELINKVKIKAFKGSFGSKDVADVKNYGNYIEASASNLNPHEGLTLYLTFDKSLMPASKKPSQKYYENPIYYLFLAPILAIFYFVAKKFNIFEGIGSIAPKYRPPADLTLMEAGLLKDNFVDFSEIKPAILELANLGYIKIEEDSEGIYLKKIKDSDENLSAELQAILNEIFSVGDLVPNNMLRIDSSIFDKLKYILHNSMVQKGYFSKSLRHARESFKFAAFSLGALTVGAFTYYVFKDTGVDIIVPAGISLAFVAVGIISLISSFRARDFSGVFFFLIWSVISSFFLFSVINSEDIVISLLLMVFIVAVGSFLIYRKMNTLTFKGILAKRHIFGLKEFIEKADKDKIKFFLQEDKKYLDKMLPYAVLFGLNKHWLELYQVLDTPTPDWYNGSLDSFNTLDFEPTAWSEPSFSDGISSMPSIDSGDFGDFGDFSGGGFGGGGGDSW